VNINIKILGVKDGDAIIITMTKASKSIIILIDSGEKSFKEKVILELNKSLSSLNKQAPDLIVCTHFDSDHLGGMIDIVNYFKRNIKCVWLHKPNEAMQKAFVLPEKYFKRRVDLIPSYEAFTFKSEMQKANLLEQAEIVLESIPQLKSLVDTINKYGINIKEPFAGRTIVNDWPEISVIGPTQEYFHKLFPNGIAFSKNLIREEASFNLLCESKLYALSTKKPCEILDENLGAKKLTATNKASIILNITCNEKKYLFTGDAGIESFENITNYKEVLKDIFFLKIPHHASRNNISSNLISLMNPIYASVSGDSYYDKEVEGCLNAKGTQVKIACDNDVELLTTDQSIVFQ
jgi:beta-lactamase superfamily II metal-dependent hydrolase